MTFPSFTNRRLHLRTDDENEMGRHATWLELFFDLVFVAAITQLTALLKNDHSLIGLLRFGLVFGAVWWAWVGHTMYSDRFDSDDDFQRVATLAQMFFALALAVFIPHLWPPESGGHAKPVGAEDAPSYANAAMFFAFSYAAIRLILIGLYARVVVSATDARPVAAFFVRIFSVGTAIWLVSAFVPAPLRSFLWLAALVWEWSAPWIWRRLLAQASVNSYHLPERLGLFTIIVLGEVLLELLMGFSHSKWDFGALVAASSGFFLLALMWWLYFDYVEAISGRLAPNTNKFYGFYLYGHGPLALGIIVLATGLETLLVKPEPTPLMALGFSLFLLTLNLLRFGEWMIRKPVSHLLPTLGFCGVLWAMYWFHLPAPWLLPISALAFWILFRGEDARCKRAI